ncbi:hypothetical protein NLJ89_g10659 [Agrocybe chaxingu]|uniref:F-box domain-containing protein n=1 Tax=Agrocybe chaxingu TaxID=84603 RepID=A0A9W8MSE5_9AGAR|nr:hypothetical protein NLJ89_g10659 [Agrocybe chaxingu]
MQAIPRNYRYKVRRARVYTRELEGPDGDVVMGEPDDPVYYRPDYGDRLPFRWALKDPGLSRTENPFVFYEPRPKTTRYYRSPFDQLPNELLCEIFLKFLEDQHERFPAKNPFKLQYPLNRKPFVDPSILVMVCHLWRRVALFLPALWSTIRISSPNLVHMRRLRRWLDNSRGQPLYLFLHDRGDSNAMTATILNLFLEHREWWRVVDFSAELRDGLSSPIYIPVAAFTRRLSPASYGRLESASINIPSTQPTLTFPPQNRASPLVRIRLDMLHNMWLAIHEAPKLRYVKWGIFWMTIRPRSTQGFSSNFSEICISHVLGTVDIMKFLQSFPRLEVFEAPRIADPTKALQFPTTHVHCPFLKRLTISSWLDTDPFLRSFDAPALMHFSVSFKDSAIPFPMDALDEFCAKSEAIEYLSLDGEHPEEDYVQFLSLQSLQSIKTLQAHFKVSDATVSLFTIHDEDPHIRFPRLHDIVMNVCATPRSALIVFQMIVSRSGYTDDSPAHTGDCAQLTKVTINTTGPEGGREDFIADAVHDDDDDRTLTVANVAHTSFPKPNTEERTAESPSVRDQDNIVWPSFTVEFNDVLHQCTSLCANVAIAYTGQPLANEALQTLKASVQPEFDLRFASTASATPEC